MSWAKWLTSQNFTASIITNFANSIWWSNVRKAFRKLTKIQQPIFPSSRAFLIFPVIIIRAYDVVWNVWNQIVSYREYCCYWERYKIPIIFSILDNRETGQYSYYNLVLDLSLKTGTIFAVFSTNRKIPVTKERLDKAASCFEISFLRNII